MKRAERLHAIAEQLRRTSPRACSAQSLADAFGVSVRTIKRDLASLERSGTPIWSHPGPGGGYGLAPGATLPPISLSAAQAVALLTAVSVAPDAPYCDLARAGVDKIIDVLDPATKQRAEKLARRVWVDVPTSTPLTVRSALEEAMEAQLLVRIRYLSSSGEVTDRRVEPMLFAAVAGTWYLVGWCQLRRAVRWFALPGVQRADVTTAPCQNRSMADIGTPPATARDVSRRLI